MTVVEPVAAGEELLITYGKCPEALYDHYGFRCACGACAGLTDADIKRMAEARWRNN